MSEKRSVFQTYTLFILLFFHYTMFSIRFQYILYRLKALSSPECFISAAEAIRYAGGDPMSYSGLYPESVFYIPGYSAETDRDALPNLFGGSVDVSDTAIQMDYFTVNNFGAEKIVFCSSLEYSDVFPTAEIKETLRLDGEYKHGEAYLYPNGLLRDTEPEWLVCEMTSIHLNEKELEYLGGILGRTGWTQDTLADRHAFFYDGCIWYEGENASGWICYGIDYNGFGDNVLYFNERFTTKLTDEDLRFLKEIETRAASS